jgi:uncharacterized protein
MSDPVFLDTSGLYALFDGDDVGNSEAAESWRSLLASGGSLHTSNYVLLELEALLQRRLGVDAVDALSTFVVPIVNVEWVDERIHSQATAALLATRRRDVSLVDHTSFILMRNLGVRYALSTDRHFAEQGFKLLPESS